MVEAKRKAERNGNITQNWIAEHFGTEWAVA